MVICLKDFSGTLIDSFVKGRVFFIYKFLLNIKKILQFLHDLKLIRIWISQSIIPHGLRKHLITVTNLIIIRFLLGNDNLRVLIRIAEGLVGLEIVFRL